MQLTGELLCIVQRPTAKELLKHPFIQKARKTAHLSELIERYRRWRSRHGIEDIDSDNDDEMLVLVDVSVHSSLVAVVEFVICTESAVV